MKMKCLLSNQLHVYSVSTQSIGNSNSRKAIAHPRYGSRTRYSHYSFNDLPPPLLRRKLIGRWANYTRITGMRTWIEFILINNGAKLDEWNWKVENSFYFHWHRPCVAGSTSDAVLIFHLHAHQSAYWNQEYRFNYTDPLVWQWQIPNWMGVREVHILMKNRISEICFVLVINWYAGMRCIYLYTL